jgi:hypothetical protein
MKLVIEIILLNIAGFLDLLLYKILKFQMINSRYKVQKSLGQGGNGQVWQAIDTLTQNKVAIKIVNLSFWGNLLFILDPSKDLF